MKQIKTSVYLLGAVILFAAFCMGALVGKGADTDGLRLVLHGPTIQTSALGTEQPTEMPIARQSETIQPQTEPDPFPININTATVEDLMRLPKIGQTIAQRIVDYRQTHGAFETVKELDMVEGIGEKILEDILNLVTVEE